MVVLLGTSYALLRSSHTSTNAYTMNVGLLEVNFYGTTNTLTYNNMYPMTDEEGLSLNDNVLNFTVKNTGQIKALYDVYIEETSTSPEFKSVIKYSINKDDNGYGETKGLVLLSLCFVFKFLTGLLIPLSSGLLISESSVSSITVFRGVVVLGRNEPCRQVRKRRAFANCRGIRRMCPKNPSSACERARSACSIFVHA